MTPSTQTCAKGGMCFGTKSTDNEREHEVAVLVCGRCSLKSIMLSGVWGLNWCAVISLVSKNM